MLDAIRKRRFELAFGPHHTLEYRVTTISPLLKLHLPDERVILEDQFLPWVEDAMLVLQLSQLVLRQTCLQAGEWFRAGVPVSSFPLRIPTAHFLQADFVSSLLRLLEQAGLPGNFLDLGVTEATIMADPEATTKTMNSLRPHGVRFTVCGHGDTPLPASSLRTLPVDTLEVVCS